MNKRSSPLGEAGPSSFFSSARTDVQHLSPRSTGGKGPDALAKTKKTPAPRIRDIRPPVRTPNAWVHFIDNIVEDGDREWVHLMASIGPHELIRRAEQVEAGLGSLEQLIGVACLPYP